MSELQTDNAQPVPSAAESFGDLKRPDRTNRAKGLALGLRIYTVLVVLIGLSWPVGKVFGMTIFGHPTMFILMQLLLLYSILLDHFYRQSDTPFRGLPWNGKEISRLIDAAAQNPGFGEQAYTAWVELDYLSKKLKPRDKKHFSQDALAQLNSLLETESHLARIVVLARLAKVAANDSLVLNLESLKSRADAIDQTGNLAVQVDQALQACKHAGTRVATSTGERSK